MDLEAVNNFGDTREGGLAGPMGLFIILLMSIATVLLIRNMNKRLRRLPDSFDHADAGKAAPKPQEDASSADAPPPGDDRSDIPGDSKDSQVRRSAESNGTAEPGDGRAGS